MNRPTLRVESLVALIALYCVVFGNGPWWSAVAAGRSLGDPATWLFMGCCFVMLVALHFFVLALPATRWTAKAWLTLIVIGTSFAVYWMRTYAVMLDPSMLRNVVSTDKREASELLTAALAVGHPRRQTTRHAALAAGRRVQGGCADHCPRGRRRFGDARVS